MKTNFYVVFDKGGFVSAYKSDKFSLKAGQFATEVTLTVPDEAFRPVSVPRVVIDLPSDAIQRMFEAKVEGGEEGAS